LVFVSSGDPLFTFQPTLDTVDCREETGWDWAGSDELMVLVAGFPNGEAVPGELPDIGSLEDNVQTFKQGDFDSGTLRSVDHAFMPLSGIGVDDQVLYFITLAEDDGFLGGFLAGAAAIVVVAAIVYFTGGAVLWTSVVGTAAALTIWGAIMSSLGEDDPLGSALFTATTLGFDQRIASTHASDFLARDPQLFGPLPRLPEEALPGEREARLIHPFADFRVTEEPVSPECNPGPCPTGETCLVNVCVSQGFVDSTAGRAFRERREFKQSGGHYVLDILWQQEKSP
jgi:hypothetical protein